MHVFEILLAIWAIVGISFFAMIRNEAAKQGTGFALIHAVVAFFWPLWAVWFLYVMVMDHVEND